MTTTRPDDPVVALSTVAAQWLRLGCIGFGGPPAHISLLRRLCVDDRGWLSAAEFEDGIAATNLLPGPASTQLAIFCAWRLRGTRGALIGGVCFIAPGLALILALAAVFLGSPPLWVRGAAAGAGAAVAAVALSAAAGLVPSSWRRIGASRGERLRWIGYLALGALTGATAGPYLVVVLVCCGLVEVAARRQASAVLSVLALPAAPASGGIGALAWVAVKVGLLSYGGGFVIIPLMQSDAVDRYHWMTGAAFLNAVALGQVTPGPVVQTVAVVGYAAAGIGGGLLAAVVAFAPSFVMVLLGARQFGRLRANLSVQAFLTGAGPAVIGGIAGAAVPLAQALDFGWQYGVLAAAAVLLAVRRGAVVLTLVLAAAAGVVAAGVGASVS
ncbi:chromate transporter [Acidothermaceae bacterium B102]|nr:chromate transporter [Acidothermaceae bacterium B102]